jgi:hypothetical protein
MVEIPADGIGNLYGSLMSEIKARLLEASMKSVTKADNQIRRTFEAEYCYHHLRRCSELVAVAAVLAHNLDPGFRAKELVKEYHPENIFKQLEKLSPKSFPRAAATEGDPRAAVNVYIADGPSAATRLDIARIYNQSGDKLHTGTVRALAKRRNKDYDFNFITQSLKTLAGLLNTHVIQLPDGRALLAYLHLDSFETGVEVHFLDPKGPSQQIPPDSE